MPRDAPVISETGDVIILRSSACSATMLRHSPADGKADRIGCCEADTEITMLTKNSESPLSRGRDLCYQTRPNQ
jgi:hypothetical protein